MKLSDRNNKIQTTARPQSPQVAGMQVTLPPGSQIPSGWVELNGQTLTGAETAYPDLWAASPAAWKSGSDLVLPYGEVESAWTDLSPYVDSTSGSPVIARLLGKARRDSGGQWYININGNGTKANSASEAIFNMATDSMKFQDQLSAGSSYNADANQAQINGSPQRIRTGAYPSNFPAWTVSFSDVRASGKPDFVESVGIPCIKLYSDTTSAVSVGINEATAAEAGVVRANKFQTKFVTSNVTSDTTFMTFNNLIPGQSYKIHSGLTAQVNAGGTDNFVSALIENGSQLIDRLVAAGNLSNQQVRLSGTSPFVATSSTLTIRTVSAGPNALIMQNEPTGRTSKMTLEECFNLVETTDLT